MTKLNRLKMGWVLFVVLAATAIAGHTQTFQTLVRFDFADGGWPAMSLVQATDGNFYGTTRTGGSSTAQCGVVFKVTPGGTLTNLHTFCSQGNCSDGCWPWSGLVLASDGFLYGPTNAGGFSDYGLSICLTNNCDWFSNYCLFGCGTIYRISPGGRFETVSPISPFYGQGSRSPLVQTVDGTFYGAAADGGINGGGTIFKMSPSGALSTFYNFEYCGPQWSCDPGSLVQGQDGDWYGTTDNTIFRITPKGRFTTLYTLCSGPNCADGTFSQGLLLASDGNFYGTTGPTSSDNCIAQSQGVGCGTVFRMTPTGELTTLYTFCSQPNCTDGALPNAGLIQATDGVLYGTTSKGGNPGKTEPAFMGFGTVFKITLAGSLTTLYSFDPPTDGWEPGAGLLQATNGIFYGTTIASEAPVSGRERIGDGTIFSLDMGLGPFVAFVHSYGKVGQTGGILGQGFTGTTNVELNGTPADFKVVSDTYLTATVPAGATTGYVTVTTPTGVLKSNVPFQVIP